jgi:hypothetical protein
MPFVALRLRKAVCSTTLLGLLSILSLVRLSDLGRLRRVPELVLAIPCGKVALPAAEIVDTPGGEPLRVRIRRSERHVLVVCAIAVGGAIVMM